MSTLRSKKLSQINNQTLCLKELKKEQTEPKVSKRKEIIKVRAEINETENKKTIETLTKGGVNSLKI